MSKAVITCTWQEVPHLNQADIAELLASYPPHEREARSKGIPSLGAGAIYPIAESEIICDPVELQPWWPRAYGMDVGWNRTAAVWGARDPEADVTYLYSEHYRGQAEPAIHADAIRGRGQWIHGAIDPASRGRSQSDGQQLWATYCEMGLMLSLAQNGVESGIYDVWTALSTGRLKVFSTLQNWLGEYRLYRRDLNGKIVKERDHLMDATRYLMVSGMNLAQVAPNAGQKMLAGMGRSQQRRVYDPHGVV